VRAAVGGEQGSDGMKEGDVRAAVGGEQGSDGMNEGDKGCSCVPS